MGWRTRVAKRDEIEAAKAHSITPQHRKPSYRLAAQKALPPAVVSTQAPASVTGASCRKSANLVEVSTALAGDVTSGLEAQRGSIIICRDDSAAERVCTAGVRSPAARGRRPPAACGAVGQNYDRRRQDAERVRRLAGACLGLSRAPGRLDAPGQQNMRLDPEGSSHQTEHRFACRHTPNEHTKCLSITR